MGNGLSRLATLGDAPFALLFIGADGTLDWARSSCPEGFLGPFQKMSNILNSFEFMVSAQLEDHVTRVLRDQEAESFEVEVPGRGALAAWAGRLPQGGCCLVLWDVRHSPLVDEDRTYVQAALCRQHPEPIALLDLESQTITWANDVADRIIREGDEHLGDPISQETWQEVRAAIKTGLRRVVEVQRGEAVYEMQIEPRAIKGAVALYGKDVTAVRQALLKAETAARAKASFLATMSHEIRTPLNAVLGMAHLLMASPLDGEQKELLKTVVNSANSLLEIIDDILDYSKIESGKLVLELKDFSVRELLEGVRKLFASSAEAKGVSLSVYLASDLPDRIVGDEARVRQVLTNLVGNALKFTSQGSIEIRCEANIVSEGYYKVQFHVRDSGIGIDPSVQGRIFQKFEQAEDSTTRRFGGTGLGLAICKNLVETMGGRISVESVPGRGATFSFYIFAQAEAAGSAPSEPKPKDVFAPLAGEIPLRILVVEDNPVNRKLLELVLEKLGYAPDFAGNGVEALRQVKHQGYDLILMDLHMPEMDGLEATRKIFDLLGRSAPKIVAVTASVMPADREACRQVGMQGFLAKPIQIAELREVLEGFRERKAA